jgi:hypothetical protein
MVKKRKDTDLQWAVPKKLNIPPDPLELRLDFHEHAVMMYSFGKDRTTQKIVSVMDVVHTLANELTYTSGLLPKNTLWWGNSASGPVVALYEEPRIRKLAIVFSSDELAKRYTIPLPGFIFICHPGRAPRLFAVKRRPSHPGDPIYHAPMLNMSRDGSSCAGSNRYPAEVDKIVESYWLSFFTSHGDIEKRSKKFPQNIIRLWEFLDGQQTRYPMDDLVKAGTVEGLMNEKMKWE